MCATIFLINNFNSREEAVLPVKLHWTVAPGANLGKMHSVNSGIRCEMQEIISRRVLVSLES